MKVFLVDEDQYFIETFAEHFKRFGCEVRIIDNARDALNILLEENRVDLVVIDVMLRLADSIRESPYSLAETENATITGLILLEDLSKRRPEVFPKRAILFSQATDANLTSRIKAFSEKRGVPYIKKEKARLEQKTVVESRIEMCRKMLSLVKGKG